MLVSLRKRIREIFNETKIRRYLFQSSDKRTLYGITVGSLEAKEELMNIGFEKIERALLLIKTYSPTRFTQVQRDVRRIFVLGDPTVVGRWHQDLQTCEIEAGYLSASETSDAAVACTIIHEATHARLMRWGFSYEESKRLRTERICFRAERAFARRLPNEEEQVRRADEMLALDGECFSDAGRRAAMRDGLRTLGVPRWVVSILDRLTKERVQGDGIKMGNTHTHRPMTGCVQ